MPSNNSSSSLTMPGRGVLSNEAPINTRYVGQTAGVDVPGSYQVQPTPGNIRPAGFRNPNPMALPYDVGNPGQGLAIGLIGTVGFMTWQDQNYGAAIKANEFETLRQHTGFDPAEWNRIPETEKSQLYKNWEAARNPLTERNPAEVFNEFAKKNSQYQQPFGPQFPKQAYGPQDTRTGPFFPQGDSDPNSPYQPWARNPETGQPYSPETLQAAKKEGMDPFFINPESGKPYSAAPSRNEIDPDTGHPYGEALPFNPFGNAPGGGLTLPSPAPNVQVNTGLWTFDFSYSGTPYFPPGKSSRAGSSDSPPSFVLVGDQYHLYQGGVSVYPNWVGKSAPPSMSNLSFTPDPNQDPNPGSNPDASPTATPIGTPRNRPGDPFGSPPPGYAPAPVAPSNPFAPRLDPKSQPLTKPGTKGNPTRDPNYVPVPGGSPNADTKNPKNPSPQPPYIPFIPIIPGRVPFAPASGKPGGSPMSNPGSSTSTSTSTNPAPANPTNPNPPTTCSYKEDDTQPTQVDYVVVTPVGRLKTPRVIQVHEKMAEATKLQFEVLGQMRESLDKIEKNSKVIKIMNMISVATTVHNAAMLSKSLADTLGSVASQVFTAVGRMSGVVGESDFVNVNEILSGQFNTFMEATLGKEVWAGTKESWLKASRIYQSGANIINSVRDIADSTRDIGEFTAQNVSKIGNSLRKFRVVGLDAYGPMDENARAKSKFFRNMDRAIDKGERLENAASSLGGAAGNVLSIQDEVKEIKENRDAFKKGLEEWGKKDEAKQKIDEAASKVDEGLEEKDLK